MRAGASETRMRAIFSSTMPAPAAMVSARCFSTVSPGAIAAAMPPCAQADEAPCPIGAAVSTVTGRGARRSAQNKPARPPPTIMTSSEGMELVSGARSNMVISSLSAANADTERSWKLLGSRFRGDERSLSGHRVRVPPSSALQVDHPLDRLAGAGRDQRVHRDLVLQVDEAIENLRQGDPLHVRAEVTRLA